MLEVVVFALTLVIAQFAVAVGIMCLVFSNWYMKKAMKKSLEMTAIMMEAMKEIDEKL